MCVYVCFSRSVMSDSLRPHGWYPTRLLCPCNSPGKNTGMGCHFLLQGTFLTQGLNLGLLHCRQFLYHLNHQVSFMLLIFYHNRKMNHMHHHQVGFILETWRWFNIMQINKYDLSFNRIKYSKSHLNVEKREPSYTVGGNAN